MLRPYGFARKLRLEADAHGREELFVFGGKTVLEGGVLGVAVIADVDAGKIVPGVMVLAIAGPPHNGVEPLLEIVVVVHASP
jgi:hypothetical protein